MYAKSKKPSVRRDVMNMLSIMRDQGLAGVRQGLKSGAFLPGLVGAVLLPHLVRASWPAPSTRGDSTD
jgi:hypothetical protein